MLAQVEAHVLADRERVQKRAGLKHHREAVFVHDTLGVNGFAFDEDFSFVGFSSPMMCLSNTLLPLPLGPMMTKISVGFDFEVDALEHGLAAVAFAIPSPAPQRCARAARHL